MSMNRPLHTTATLRDVRTTRTSRCWQPRPLAGSPPRSVCIVRSQSAWSCASCLRPSSVGPRDQHRKLLVRATDGRRHAVERQVPPQRLILLASTAKPQHPQSQTVSASFSRLPFLGRNFAPRTCSCAKSTAVRAGYCASRLLTWLWLAMRCAALCSRRRAWRSELRAQVPRGRKVRRASDTLASTLTLCCNQVIQR